MQLPRHRWWKAGGLLPCEDDGETLLAWKGAESSLIFETSRTLYALPSAVIKTKSWRSSEYEILMMGAEDGVSLL